MSTVITAFAFLAIVSSQFGLNTDPEQPIQGGELEILYDAEAEQATLRDPAELTFIYTVESRDTLISGVEPMSADGDVWSCAVAIPDDAHSVSFFLEDSLGGRVDDSGQWFHRPVVGASGSPVPNGHLSLARALLLKADPMRDRARDAAASEIELFPWNWEAYRWLWEAQSGSPKSEDEKKRIASEVDALLDRATDSLPLLYETAVVSYVDVEEIEKAQDVFRRYVAASPKRDRLERMLNVYFLGFLTEPERLTHAAEELFLELPDEFQEVAMYQYYFALNLAFRTEDARGVLKTLITRYPESDYMPLLLYRHVQSTTELGTEENAAGLTNYLERFPEGPFADMAALYLGRHYARTDWEEAKRYYRMAIRIDSSMFHLYNAFAFDCAERRVDLDEGERAILKAIDLADRDYYRRRAYHVGFGEREEMRERDLSALYDTYGWIKFQQGRYGEAVTLLEKAVGLIGEENVYSEMLGHLADSYTKVHKPDEALEIYFEILGSEPENEEMKEKALGIFIDQGGTEREFEEALAASVSVPKERGTVAADFTVKNLDEEEVTLEGLKGQVVVLNFWATWCGPCRKEIPVLNRLVETFGGDDDVIFLGISSEKKRNVQAFTSTNEFAYEVCYDGGNASRAYGVLYIPTHVIVDRAGLVYSKHVGFTPGIGDLLEKEIREILGR